jgi:hypothetical protein
MKSLASLLRIVTMALILAAPLAAHADDDSLPLPQDGTEEEVPFNPPSQDFDESLPGAGDDALPEPMGSDGSSDNVVNNAPAEDDIFLPTPQGQGEPSSYTPLSTGVPVNTARNEDDGDWRYGWNKRPIFTLHGGISIVNYQVEGVAENLQAPIVGASVRVWDIGQTVFLHAYGAFSWVNIGGVGPISEVKDAIVNFGPMIEIGIGRRLSLFGSILKRNHNIKAGPDASRQFGSVDNFASQITEDKWMPGVGIQYDFYVIPHGSLGVRAHVEQDVALVALTMSIEPAPRKKLSLNFNEEP